MRLTIDWSGPLTKGRQVYARTVSRFELHDVNYEGGFLVGWDRWSDGRYASTVGPSGWPTP